MKIKSICEDGITFDNGSTLAHYHNQDCCEAVYADWKNMIAMTESEGNELKLSDYDFLTIYWIQLFLLRDWDSILLPCKAYV